MSIEKELHARSNSACELCGTTTGLSVYHLSSSDHSAGKSVLVCNTCLTQITNPAETDANHWRCLSNSMWSTVPAVQVIAWRMLNRLHANDWAQNLLDMLYLDEQTLEWAQETEQQSPGDDSIKHIDSNGVLLQNGDTVVLIKDLDVKGGGFTAKRGTSVRGITLVADNPEQIEGRVNGQHIVLLTKYLKKAG